MNQAPPTGPVVRGMTPAPPKENGLRRMVRRMHALNVALIERLDRAGLLNPQEQQAAEELRLAFNAMRYGWVQPRLVDERVRDLKRLISK